MIHIYNRQRALPIAKSALRKAISALLAYLHLEGDELSVYFVTPEKIGQLHQEFFGDPTPTDCITFPIDKTYLGDIFVCPQVALDYAKKKGLDPQQEMLLYVVHGLLHLAGYDDIDPADRRVMRKKEKSCMRHLNELFHS